MWLDTPATVGGREVVSSSFARLLAACSSSGVAESCSRFSEETDLDINADAGGEDSCEGGGAFAEKMWTQIRPIESAAVDDTGDDDWESDDSDSGAVNITAYTVTPSGCKNPSMLRVSPAAVWAGEHR